MHIHRKIEKFLNCHDYPPTKFGRAVANDPRLVLDMRRGRQMRSEMVARAEAFMNAYSTETASQERAG